MSDFENYSSDEASNDDIEFPKTPGGLSRPTQSQSDDDNSDDESNKNNLSESESESAESDNDNKRKNDLDSEHQVHKKRSVSSDEHDSPDNRLNHESNQSSDSSSESEDELVRRQSKIDERRSDFSSEDEDNIRQHRKVVASDSDSASESEQVRAKRKQDSEKDATAEDLFGELSEEDDGEKNDQARSEEEDEEMSFPKRARHEVNDDEDDVIVDNQQKRNEVMNDIFGDDDDEYADRAQERIVMDEEEEEQFMETRIDVEIPRVVADLGNSIHFVKLPNFLSIDTHPYDPQWYEDEIDEDEIHDDEGRARLKLKVENTIRWRNLTHEDGSTSRESNARVVKWSDGSKSLYLGDEIFDIQTLNLLPGENNHLFIRQGTGLQGQAVFHTKLTFRPFSTESFTHRKLTLSLADRSQKTQKICVLPSVGKDPEAHRSEMIKKEEDRLKASIRKESQQRRVKDRAYTRGAGSSFLDLDDEDDENISISKIKNQFKRNPSYGSASSNSRLSPDSEPSLESNEESEDDSEGDIFEKKKPTEKRKIVESDDEDED